MPLKKCTSRSVHFAEMYIPDLYDVEKCTVQIYVTDLYGLDNQIPVL